MRPDPVQRINKKALNVWRIIGAITSLIYWLPTVGYILFHYFIGFYGWIGWLLLILSSVLTFITIVTIPKIKWLRWRYEITEHEISLKYGVFIIRRSIIPMVRVQHVDTTQGPFLRYYGLATVMISTAAGSHEIPALSIQVADEVRNRISELARVADHDV